MTPKKKHKFQKKFGEYADTHKLKAKIKALKDDFTKLTQSPQAGLEGKCFNVLVDRYNEIDKLMSEGMKSSADTVKSDFGYQRSLKLTKALDRVYLWKAVLSCVRRKVSLPNKVHELSKSCNITVPPGRH